MTSTAAKTIRRTTTTLLIAIGAVATAPAQERSAPTDSAAAPIVFFDIAGPDMAAQSAFYAAVLGWAIAPDGAITVKAQGPLPATLQGTLRVDAANDSLLYFGVRDVAATLETVSENGGTVDAPRFEVPGVVIMGLFRDPAGNRMGLIEVNDNNVAIVP